ncbi:hypothetical protein SDC9_98083 [bioreactor metagenome]|uniref:Uncharacterized protein n=1 Tax=bioreactor metagenome TaxID=1076179 RepID=A0A645ADQ1_9ZZZZ
MRSRSNSLSRRSSIISICSNPKKPHLNPKPRATDVSGSNEREASLSLNFSSASRRSAYFAPSAGYMPQKTTGSAFLNPGIGSSAGFSALVIVSPTRAMDRFFIEPVRYPTSPASSFSVGSEPNALRYPSSIISNSAPPAFIFTSCPRLRVPSNNL